MTGHSPLIEAMLDAALAAGEGLKRDFANIAQLQVRHKQGLDDMFSEADLRAEQTVREMLVGISPGLWLPGRGRRPGSGRDRDNVWIVDPLDGTTNFLIGLPLFAVNIALANEGKVVAGVTHVPLLGRDLLGRARARRLSERFADPCVRAAGNDRSRARRRNPVREQAPSRAVRCRNGEADAPRLRHSPARSRQRSTWPMSLAAASTLIGNRASAPGTSPPASSSSRRPAASLPIRLGQPLVLDSGTVLASTPQLHAELVDAIAPVDG